MRQCDGRLVRLAGNADLRPLLSQLISWVDANTYSGNCFISQPHSCLDRAAQNWRSGEIPILRSARASSRGSNLIVEHHCQVSRSYRHSLASEYLQPTCAIRLEALSYPMGLLPRETEIQSDTVSVLESSRFIAIEIWCRDPISRNSTQQWAEPFINS